MSSAPKIGKCPLCVTDGKELQVSHLTSKSIYKLCRAQSAKNPNPVVVGNGVAFQSSMQITGYLLCRECEQLLNRGGESWTVPKLAEYRGSFPLYQLLQSGPAEFVERDLVAYATIRNPEFRADYLTHFAMGIFWKAAVHHWNRGDETLIRISPAYREALRKYLRHEAGFPKFMALAVIMLPPAKAFSSIDAPRELSGLESRAYRLYVPGIQFTLAVGRGIPPHMVACCIGSNPGRPIVVSDISESASRQMRMALAQARFTDGVRATMDERKRELVKSAVSMST
jgi:hypothetical protein